jgi:hypothetical protein
MAIHRREGGLKADEKWTVKTQLPEGMRNHDTQARVNTGRSATIPI